MRYFLIVLAAIFGIVGCGPKGDTSPTTDTKVDAAASAPKVSSLDDYNSKFKPIGDAIDAAMKDSFKPGASKAEATANQTKASSVIESSEKEILALNPPDDIKPLQAMVVAQLDSMMPIVMKMWEATNKGDQAALAKMGPDMDAAQKKSEADMQKAFGDAGYDFAEFKKNNDFKKTDATKTPAAGDKPAGS